MMDEKEITFTQFKAWMLGFTVGKGDELPNKGEWELILKMLERTEDTISLSFPQPTPTPRTPILYDNTNFPIAPYCSGASVTGSPVTWGDTNLSTINNTPTTEKS